MIAKRLGLWLLSALPLALVVGLAWYHSTGPRTDDVGTVVAVPYEHYRRAALYTSLALWVVLPVLLIVASLRRSRRPYCRALLSALVIVSLVQLVAAGDAALGWHDLSSLRLRGGAIYRIRRSLPGYLLTMDVSRGLLLRRERVLGYGDSEFPALLVRPQAELPLRPDASSSLVASADGRWLVLLTLVAPDGPDSEPSCQTHLAYDRHTGKAYAGEDLAEVSPFLLIGPRDHLNASDARALLSRTGKVRPAGLIMIDPSAVTIARGLRNANPEVREVAARLLDRMDAVTTGFAAALDTLREVAFSSDPVAREAAQRALRRLKAAQQSGH